jgi:hypothetical protein
MFEQLICAEKNKNILNRLLDDLKMFQLCSSGKIITPDKSLSFEGLSGVIRTQSRDRTGMEVNPLVFETSASTNSAIWAIALQK